MKLSKFTEQLRPLGVEWNSSYDPDIMFVYNGNPEHMYEFEDATLQIRKDGSIYILLDAFYKN